MHNVFQGLQPYSIRFLHIVEIIAKSKVLEEFKEHTIRIFHNRPAYYNIIKGKERRKEKVIELKVKNRGSCKAFLHEHINR